MSEDTISTNNRSRSRVDSSWQDPDRAHELVKTEGGWKCQCCYRSWLKKPRAKCLGLPIVPGAAAESLRRGSWSGRSTRPAMQKTQAKVINWQDAISIDTALRSNLQLKHSTKPIAARRDPLGDPNFDLLFARTEFEECEPNFYPIASWDKNHRQGLKTLWEIGSKRLELKHGAKPAAVYFRSSHPDGECRWRLLYRVEDTQPVQPKYISNANLQSIYLISDGWLARIGEPDLLLDNPHGRYYAPMKMYALVRIEDFLSTHAQEYAEWLEGRGKRLAIARAIVAKSQATKLRIETQTQQCLQCASHSALLGGTCCAIYPLGLPTGVPLECYCPDFHPRAEHL
ncbi:hypothetical protein [Chamaesiphon minutus]|uniref:Uncharacterized protein n=1 Tax=Chamaesiphon minutus (strain ATCC 27169 / PCC 6605) TaxID=1173020 RepID=K9UDT2_CHAP6|nr:hypothetical protein [Chamaesiphon minutus]AFY92783.1 hypothetical protein Cha6605_1638 [Chamaesiphon minutus PCC 6605]